ncbi:MAG: hypothetical protein U0694_07090 [Anaerolineae bacterium]
MEQNLSAEIIPGKLRLHMRRHELTLHGHGAPCTTLFTEGLWAHGQKELLCTLLLPRVKQPDLTLLLQFFRQVYQLAEQGQLVDEGGRTGIHIPNLFGRDDICGFVYIRSEPLEGIELPNAPTLAMIMVFGDELEAYDRYGATRLLAKLGEASHTYPCPFWSDPTREPVLSLESLEQSSLLAKTPAIYVQEASFVFHAPRIRLSLKPEARQHFQPLAQYPPDRPLALYTRIEDGADACLVWHPNARQPHAITPGHGSAARMTGNFIVFVPQQTRDGGQMVEDGFGIFLTDASWTALRDALMSGNSLSIKGQEGLYDLEVTWLKEAYLNPIDQTALRIQGGWKTVHPDPQAARPPSNQFPITQTHIVLLTDDESLRANIGVEALSHYIISVQAAVREGYEQAAPRAGFDLILQFELDPGDVGLKIVSRPTLDEQELQAIHDHLLTLGAPVVQGEVRFQVLCALFGGSGQALAQFH